VSPVLAKKISQANKLIKPQKLTIIFQAGLETCHGYNVIPYRIRIYEEDRPKN